MARGVSVVLAEWSAIRWSAVLAVTGTGVALAALDLWVLPAGPGTGLVWVVAALLAGAVALGLDCPTRGLTAAVPASQRFRDGARLSLALPALAGWAAYGVLVSQRGAGLAEARPALALVGAALILAGAAVALVLQRAGMTEPGGLVSSGVLLAVVGLLVMPLPGEFMPFDLSAGWTGATTLWSAAAGLAVVLTWWATGDGWRHGPGHPARKESRAGEPGRPTAEPWWSRRG